MVAGCWLLVAGCWLLVAGCWLLVAGYDMMIVVLSMCTMCVWGYLNCLLMDDLLTYSLAPTFCNGYNIILYYESTVFDIEDGLFSAACFSMAVSTRVLY